MYHHCHDYDQFIIRIATETEIASVRPLKIVLQEQPVKPLTFRCGLCSGLRVLSKTAAVTHLREA